MKKFKALFLSIALSLTFATALTAVGCSGCGEEGDVSSSSVGTSLDSSIDFGEEQSPVSIRFVQGQVNVKQYEDVALELMVKGTSQKVVYTSSDETVATVDENGVVTAKDKVATATITATVEGISASCVVNVEKSPYAPEIVCNQREYTIEDGEVLKFSVDTEWNKTPVEENVTYAVSFAEDSLLAKASIAVTGNEITVTSAGVESFNVIVSTTVRGIYTSKSIQVNVIKAKLKIQPTSAIFAPSKEGFKTSISTTSEFESDYVNSRSLDFIVVKGSEKLETVDIDWSLSKEANGLVKIQDGNVIGQKRGTAQIKGTATHNGETAEVQIVCEVIPPEAHLEETTVLDVSRLTRYTVQGELLGTLQDAEFQGKKVTTAVRGKNLMFDKSAFTKKASLLGNQQLVINTDIVRYTMDVEVYTMIIKDAQDLRDMKTHAATDDTEWSIRFEEERNSQFFDGYFILGNDIAFNDVIESFTNTGTVWGVQGKELDYSRGFKGVFDGRGYTIDGLESCYNKYAETQSGGIFGYLAREGVVKNVTFTNAVLRGLNGFICAYGDGLIENVVVSYKKIGGDVKVSDVLGTGEDYRAMATFFSRGAGVNATVKNCIVDASMAEISYETAIYEKTGVEECDLNLFGKAVNVVGSYVLCSDAKVLEHAGNATKLSGFAELSQQASVFEDYDKELWQFVNGTPMLTSMATASQTVTSLQFVDTKDTLFGGFSMPVRLDNPYVEIEVSDVAGVSYKNGILTATDEAKGEQVTLTAKLLMNPGVRATHVVTIDWFGETVAKPTGDVKAVLHTTPFVEIGDNSWLGEENYVYLGDTLIGSGASSLKIDFDAYGWNDWREDVNVTVVTVKNDVKTCFGVALDFRYDETVKAHAETISDSFFHEKDSAWRKVLKDDTYVPAEEDKATGFANANKYKAKTKATFGNPDAEIWGKGDIGHVHYISDNLSQYREVWFAIKTVGCNLQVYPNYVNLIESEWIYFHLTQTSEFEWMIEINDENGVVSYKQEKQISQGSSNPGLNENALNAILYNGWAQATAYEDFFAVRIHKPEITAIDSLVIYTTEVVGVKKN